MAGESIDGSINLVAANVVLGEQNLPHPPNAMAAKRFDRAAGQVA